MTREQKGDKKQVMKSVGAILKESIVYVADNWVMLLKVYGWSVLIYFGFMLLMGVILFAVGAAAAALGLLTWNLATGAVAAVASIAWFIFFIALTGKMFYFVLMAIKEPITDIRAEWKKISLKQGLSLYWILILMVFSIYGSLILLVIPGIMVAGWISLSLFVRLEQGERGLRALMLSRDYVKGYWWQIFGRYLVVTLVSIPFTIILMIVYQKLLEMGGILAVLGFVIYLLGYMVVTAIYYRLNYAIYADLVRIKGKLEFKTTGWRTFRWSLLAYAPLILGVAGLLIAFALALINPAAQIEKAKNEAARQELLKVEQALPSVK